MNKYLSAVFLFGLVLSAITAFSPRTAANDFKIIPGERLGDVALTMSLDDILTTTLGFPEMASGYPSGAGVDFVYEERQVRVSGRKDTGQILRISTFWTRGRVNPYMTDKGIRIGASMNQIVKAYGPTGCYFSEDNTSRSVGWGETGIVFRILTSPDLPLEVRNLVGEIGVFRRTKQLPEGVKPCAELR